MIAVVLILAAACGGGQEGDSPGGSTESGEQMYPDIVEAELQNDGGDSYKLSVTVSSPYDSPERYADGWRVLDQEGEVLGKRELTHEHSATQPFTRTQTGLRIPEGVGKITVEVRDLENGYGGETANLPVESS